MSREQVFGESDKDLAGLYAASTTLRVERESIKERDENKNLIIDALNEEIDSFLSTLNGFLSLNKEKQLNIFDAESNPITEARISFRLAGAYFELASLSDNEDKKLEYYKKSYSYAKKSTEIESNNFLLQKAANEIALIYNQQNNPNAVLYATFARYFASQEQIQQKQPDIISESKKKITSLNASSNNTFQVSLKNEYYKIYLAWLEKKQSITNWANDVGYIEVLQLFSIETEELEDFTESAPKEFLENTLENIFDFFSHKLDDEVKKCRNSYQIDNPILTQITAILSKIDKIIDSKKSLSEKHIGDFYDRKDSGYNCVIM